MATATNKPAGVEITITLNQTEANIIATLLLASSWDGELGSKAEELYNLLQVNGACNLFEAGWDDVYGEYRLDAREDDDFYDDDDDCDCGCEDEDGDDE